LGGNVIAGSFIASMSAPPRLFDGWNVKHRVPSIEQPRPHDVVVAP
jgi:hypothetical protein